MAGMNGRASMSRGRLTGCTVLVAGGAGWLFGDVVLVATKDGASAVGGSGARHEGGRR